MVRTHWAVAEIKMNGLNDKGYNKFQVFKWLVISLHHSLGHWYQSLSQRMRFISGFQHHHSASPGSSQGLARIYAWKGCVAGISEGYTVLAVSLCYKHISLLSQSSVCSRDDASACSGLFRVYVFSWSQCCAQLGQEFIEISGIWGRKVTVLERQLGYQGWQTTAGQDPVSLLCWCFC